MKKLLKVACPAKLNLFLAVGPRDARGYHPVRTIMQAVSLFDELEIEVGKDRFEVEGVDLPVNNSVTKALRLAREVFSVPPLSIRLTKNIPLEAGLGGGSSDAAGLLRALKTLTLGASEPELQGLAEAIGVDTPLFLTGGRARGDHYGEVVTPLPDPPEEWFVIAKPDVGCPTAEMYAKLNERPREWREWPEKDELYNDFERVAPQECLDLIETLRSLGARDAGLSGSGSAVFGRFANAAAAERAAPLMQTRSWVCRSLTRTESLGR